MPPIKRLPNVKRVWTPNNKNIKANVNEMTAYTNTVNQLPQDFAPVTPVVNPLFRGVFAAITAAASTTYFPNPFAAVQESEGGFNTAGQTSPSNASAVNCLSIPQAGQYQVTAGVRCDASGTTAGYGQAVILVYSPTLGAARNLAISILNNSSVAGSLYPYTYFQLTAATRLYYGDLVWVQFSLAGTTGVIQGQQGDGLNIIKVAD